VSIVTSPLVPSRSIAQRPRLLVGSESGMSVFVPVMVVVPDVMAQHQPGARSGRLRQPVGQAVRRSVVNFQAAPMFSAQSAEFRGRYAQGSY